MEDDEVRAILDSYLNAQEFWEEQFDVILIDYHQCDYLPEDNASKIMKAECLETKQRLWYLFNARLASFYDVELGEAEKVADFQSGSMIAISYCPFCGYKLI